MPRSERPRFRNRAHPVSLVTAALVRCTRTAHDRADEESSALPTLVIPRRGVFRFHAGRQTTIGDPNTALLFHPDEPYRITHPTDHGDDCFALRFDPGVVADALGPASEFSATWTLDARTQRALHRDAHAVLAADDPCAGDEIAFGMLTILGRLKPAAPHARDGARIEAVRERLAADVGAAASLSAIARDVGLSPFHLARRFRARTGTSLHQYRLALRLAVASTAIRDGADDFTQLALELGFAGSSHFSAAFRTAYGHSPTAARPTPRRR